MEENKSTEVTINDISKHYLSSVIIYGVVLLFITFCPGLNSQIENTYFNYIVFFVAYYICYIIFALPIYLKFKPKSVLNSKSVAIWEYIKRQFNRKEQTKTWLENIEPKEHEKQAFMILFIKAFFGVYTVNLLCNQYLPSMQYNIGFLKEMYSQAYQYASTSGVYWGIAQYIDDTTDMWIKISLTVTTLVYAISYLTDITLLKSKIKSADTTPLGVLSCLLCFYPFVLLTEYVIPHFPEEFVPINNFALKLILSIILILANIISLIAILRLGTRVGNLTNRGIVTGFPYNIVRHPDYAMQICIAVVLTVPIYLTDISAPEKLMLAVGTIGWIYIYYLRSITEERHLIKDEDYQKYVDKVKYRFIPKLF